MSMYQKIRFGKIEMKIAVFRLVLVGVTKFWRKIEYNINKQIFKYFVELNLTELVNKTKQPHKNNHITIN